MFNYCLNKYFQIKKEKFFRHFKNNFIIINMKKSQNISSLKKLFKFKVFN